MPKGLVDPETQGDVILTRRTVFDVNGVRSWTLRDVQAEVVNATRATLGKDAYRANFAYAELQDHWQRGTTWPISVGNDDGQRAEVLASVYPQFTPVDVIGEVLDRVIDGVFSREPTVDFIPLNDDGLLPTAGETEAQRTAREQRLADVRAEADAMRAEISAWWDREQLHEHGKVATRRARWSGRGILRLWIPGGLLDALVDEQRDPRRIVATELPSVETLADAFDRIKVDAPLPDSAAVITDPNSQRKAGLFLFKVAGRSDSGRATLTDAAEVWQVGRDGTTTATVLSGQARDGAPAPEPTTRLSLGGRLPMAEMRTPVIITEAVRRQQSRLNFCETVLVRVAETAGFPERYTLNAADNGVWLATPPSNGSSVPTETRNGVKYYLHAEPRTIGAATLTDLRGFPYDQGVDGRGFTTPSVEKFDPTDPQFAIKAARHARATILETCKQGHVIRPGQEAVSGYSQEQARADHEKDLSRTAAAAEGMIRQIIEAAIAMAADMTDDEGYRGFLDRYRCVVTFHVTAGPPSPEQQEKDALAVERGLMSPETAMQRNNIEDADAEQKMIDARPEARLKLSLKKAELLRANLDADMPMEAAMALAGYTPEERELIRTNAGQPVTGEGLGEDDRADTRPVPAPVENADPDPDEVTE